MRHLGPRVSALVDGQLSPRAAERALAHAVGCPRCRAALDAERAARRVVSAAGDFEPSEDFTSRLIELPGAAPAGLLDMSGPPPMTRHPRTRPGTRVALAATAGAAAAVGGLYLLGGAAVPTVTEAEVRAAARDAMPAGAAMLGNGGLSVDPGARADDGAGEGSVEDVARTAAQGDGTASAVAWLRENGWSSPEMVPAGLEIVAVRQVDDGVLEIELEGDDAHVVVVERRGVLGPEELAGAHPVLIGDVQAYVISEQPWTAVMQSGDDVVVVTCTGADAAGRSVLGAMPPEPAAAPGGIAERVARGWERAVAAVWSVAPGAERRADARPGG